MTSRDDPHVRCLPDNPPRAWTLPHLTKIAQTPKFLALLYEVNAMYRQIFTDGRPQPTDPNPTWNGYSTAHWEGDTLVVHTEGFRDDLWIDVIGSPMSSAAKMTERMRRPNYGTLEIELTIDDPKTYTRPFTVNLGLTIEVDTELVDEFCSREREVVRADAAKSREVTRDGAGPRGCRCSTRAIGCVFGRVPIDPQDGARKSVRGPIATTVRTALSPRSAAQRGR